jgi:dTDP-4-dehydrorhamnose reductase
VSSAARPLPTHAFVLGHRGMLGHVVARHLESEGIAVRTSDLRYSGSPTDALVEAVRASGAPLVVNCLGRIKQKSTDPADLATANALFPLHLVQRLHAGQHLVHASTDCVFAGTRGSYRVDDERDAADDYGRSKVLGEGVARWPNATVVRVSIIGPDIAGPGAAGRGLLGWMLAQPADVPLRGFTNHRWNGITTLEWARVAVELVARRNAGERIPAVVQPGSDAVTKHELLGMIREAFDTGHTIEPVEAPEAVDRTLVPTMHRPSIAEQLRAMAAWHGQTREAVAC